MFTRDQLASRTSEMEGLKTNEFQTRRRLRLQQVREQSKELARTVRERASRERSRQLERSEYGRHENYIDRQERLVERLERLHAGSLNAVGSAHQQAAEINEQAKPEEKSTDYSKKRGKQAADDLRRIKQQELDKKKEQLERKLIARNLANERSRLKLSKSSVQVEPGSGDAGPSAAVGLSSNENGITPDQCAGTKSNHSGTKETQNIEINIESAAKKKDMETQWSADSFREWIPNDFRSVDELQNLSLQNSSNVADQERIKSKRTNLFAVSEGMPESLLGTVHRIPEAAPVPSNPSLTLVSEFLRTRDHRLQKPTPGFHKVGDSEMQGLRETLHKSRRKGGITQPFRSKVSPPRVAKPSVSAQSLYGLNKKQSVLHYDHTTKTSRDLPLQNTNLVERAMNQDIDAYALALKESEEMACNVKHQEDTEECRSRNAMSRQKVAQEYRDTIAYLQTMSRNGGSRPIETAYMDDYQQNKRKINHQKKLQHEFEKIQSITKPKATCVSNSIIINDRVSNTSRGRHVSPLKDDIASKTRSSLIEGEILFDEIRKTSMEKEDTTAETLKDGIKQSSKHGNTVTFDFTPSSYTYTSRVKHTPPTRDKPWSPDNKKGHYKDRNNIHNIEIENIDSNDTSDNTLISNCSSDYDVIVQTHNKPKYKVINDGKSDVRKFIVYKIKDSSDEDAIKKIKKKYKASKQNTKDSKSEDNNMCDVNEDENDSCKFKEPVLASKKSDKSGGEMIESKQDLKSSHHKDDPDYLKPDNKSSLNRSTKIADETKKPFQWDIGSLQESRENCSKVRDQATQPSVSATTSAATFKTAKSDKSVTPACPGGYVKVLDEAGAEAGKFFIGTSHLSGDNPYEVVIQLKRKEESSTDKTIQNSNPTASTVSENMTKPLCKPNAVCKCSLIKTPVRETQFSSSSSTVYLSPPDMILPKFLKADYRIKGEEVYVDSKKNFQGVEDIPLSFCSQRSHVRSKDPGVNSSHKKKCKRSVHKPTSHSESSIISLKTNSDVLLKTKCTERACYNSNNPSDCKGKQKSKIMNVRVDKCKKLSKPREKGKKAIIGQYRKELHEMMENAENKTNVSSYMKFRSNLSPIVQKYINELLLMSDDTSKNVKFSALHCSTVSTPGSSVVNVSTNVDRTAMQKEKCYIEGKINEILTRNLINHLKKHRMPSSWLPKNADSKQCSKDALDTKKFSKETVPPSSTSTSSDTAKYAGKGVGDVPHMHLSKRRAKQKPLYRHKIKSLNISKNIIKYFKTVPSEERQRSVFYAKGISSDTGPRSSEYKRKTKGSKNSIASKYTPVTRKSAHKCLKNPVTDKSSGHCLTHKSRVKALAILKKTSSAPNNNIYIHVNDKMNENANYFQIVKQDVSPTRKNCSNRDKPSDFGAIVRENNKTSIQKHQYPDANSKQTNINSENLVNIAEQKLENMEKIADLTEKCTKRLSNLAKVLDEVRKHKSNMYQEICSHDASYDHTSTKHVNSLRSTSYEDSNDVISGLDFFQNLPDNHDSPQPNIEIILSSEKDDIPEDNNYVNTLAPSSPNNINGVSEFVPILGDIPKPETSSSWKKHSVSKNNGKIINETKCRSKPPPALCRVNLKSEETLLPHELSTVLEVDSPMSTRNASSRARSRVKSPVNINVTINSKKQTQLDKSDMVSRPEAMSPVATTAAPAAADQVYLQTPEKRHHKIQSPSKRNNSPLRRTNTLRRTCVDDVHNGFLSPLPVEQQISKTENSKLKMIDLKKFNEIMLKPFISIEEYARQYDVALLDEGANIEDTTKNKNHTNKDEDSLNSDGTLPDIISELLKRKIISEPFDFDVDSNLDSNGLSSESNVSLLALSQMNKQGKKMLINKIKRDSGDRTDTQSLSPKNDLEKAFEDLGMGWASSTLKKTKETLALSSSTSTMSSAEHSKCCKFRHIDKSKNKLFQLQGVKSTTSKTHSEAIQWVHTAATTAAVFPNFEDKENICEQSSQSSKHSVELQTSLPFQQPVSVKEFLTNSLADKITFSCKSPQPNEAEHFSSLYSTKMTTDNSIGELGDKPLIQNDLSRDNAKQRTSTPVQLFKSLTYNSSTSDYSNSYGLFSNVEDISSVKNGSSFEKDDLTVPNLSLKIKKAKSDCSGSGNNLP